MRVSVQPKCFAIFQNRAYVLGVNFCAKIYTVPVLQPVQVPYATMYLCAGASALLCNDAIRNIAHTHMYSNAFTSDNGECN